MLAAGGGMKRELEVRPVLPEHYPAIWTTVDETSQDEWGYSQATTVTV